MLRGERRVQWPPARPCPCDAGRVSPAPGPPVSAAVKRGRSVRLHPLGASCRAVTHSAQWQQDCDESWQLSQPLSPRKWSRLSGSVAAGRKRKGIFKPRPRPALTEVRTAAALVRPWPFTKHRLPRWPARGKPKGHFFSMLRVAPLTPECRVGHPPAFPTGRQPPVSPIGAKPRGPQLQGGPWFRGFSSPF